MIEREARSRFIIPARSVCGACPAGGKPSLRDGDKVFWEGFIGGVFACIAGGIRSEPRYQGMTDRYHSWCSGGSGGEGKWQLVGVGRTSYHVLIPGPRVELATERKKIGASLFYRMESRDHLCHSGAWYDDHWQNQYHRLTVLTDDRSIACSISRATGGAGGNTSGVRGGPVAERGRGEQVALVAAVGLVPLAGRSGSAVGMRLAGAYGGGGGGVGLGGAVFVREGASVTIVSGGISGGVSQAGRI